MHWLLWQQIQDSREPFHLPRIAGSWGFCVLHRKQGHRTSVTHPNLMSRCPVYMITVTRETSNHRFKHNFRNTAIFCGKATIFNPWCSFPISPRYIATLISPFNQVKVRKMSNNFRPFQVHFSIGKCAAGPSVHTLISWAMPLTNIRLLGAESAQRRAVPGHGT
jgi:hypothetical protein